MTRRRTDPPRERPSDADDTAATVDGPGAAPSRPSATRPPRRATFVAGDLLAARYRVVRFLAHGGMGEVYEVEDLELGGRVALKTMRPEVSELGRVIERFKREVSLSRRVTHPNVCRVFEFGQHLPAPVAGAGEGPAPVLFLTMELLQGETLAECLQRRGRLPAAEALPLVGDLAAALDAAHQAGVIHRDFKSGNVLLVPVADSENAVRAVVTDFGLARGSLDGDERRSLTQLGGIVGTPAYMAPEQAEGEEATRATDIYALGVVLYEMMTGALPFAGSALEMAVRRSKHPPSSPRQHAPDLDPRWEGAILRCLARDPADRFGSAGDVVRALHGERVAPPHGERRGRRRRRLLAGAAAAAFLLATLAVVRQQRPAVPGSGAAPARKAVAVLDFQNLGGRAETAWLATAIAEMLRTEIAAGDRVRTVSGESVARARIELALPQTDSLAPDTLGRLRANLGTDFVVLGSYLVLDPAAGRIRLDARLQDAASGETVTSVDALGTETDLPDLIGRVGNRLRGELGLGELSAETSGEIRASLPTRPEAARLYAEGLARLRQYEAVAARDLLERADALEPAHPLVHLALADAWAYLEHDLQALEEAKQAHAYSATLSRRERLQVEGRYREASGEWPRAVEIYRTLLDFFPDQIEYGLGLVRAEIGAGLRDQALATVTALRRLPRPAADDPRIDLAEANAAEWLSDYGRAQVAGARAAAKGRAAGARLIVAEGREREAWGSFNLGDLTRAIDAASEARETYAAVGDRAGVARAQVALAAALWQQGHLERSRESNEAALAFYREVDNRSRIAEKTNAIGFALHQECRFDESTRLHAEALALYRELGIEADFAWAVWGLGWNLADQGRLDEAEQKYQEALRLAESSGYRRLIGYILWSWGELSLERGDLAEARRLLERSLLLRQELGHRGSAAESRLSLAALDIAEGRLDDAAEHVAEALLESEREGALDNQATALGRLAAIARRRGDAAGAAAAIERMRPLAARSENPRVRLGFAIEEARAGGAGGEAGADRGLAAAREEAKRLGLAGVELEALLAEVERSAPAARPGLATALERRARAAGYGRIAERARALR